MATAANPPPVVKLVPVLDLKAAAPLAGSLLEKRGSDLLIDGSEVERLGSQCLQVLMSARQTWKTDGKMLTISGASEAMQTIAAQLGATHALFTDAETVP